MKEELAPFLLIAAAGRGRRMKETINKQYLFLAGKPVLAHTLKTFLDLNIYQQVVVIIAPGEEDAFRELVQAPFFPAEKRIAIVMGARERQSSVYNGLKYLRESGRIAPKSIVAVHDGARPLATAELILRVYKEALSFGAAVPGIALKDTIKEVDNGLNVVKTPSRDRFMAIQTPQCFHFSLLWQAYQRAREDGFLGSDDASLVERLDRKVKVVPGSDENLKITTPIDLLLAEAYLSARC
jgi:2-C-methyl-D-erythritol 4-phosphate cytidylyltransferase